MVRFAVHFRWVLHLRPPVPWLRPDPTLHIKLHRMPASSNAGKRGIHIPVASFNTINWKPTSPQPRECIQPLLAPFPDSSQSERSSQTSGAAVATPPTELAI
nr:unnamed protein product [Digitaria exilis]